MDFSFFEKNHFLNPCIATAAAAAAATDIYFFRNIF